MRDDALRAQYTARDGILRAQYTAREDVLRAQYTAREDVLRAQYTARVISEVDTSAEESFQRGFSYPISGSDELIHGDEEKRKSGQEVDM